MFKNLFKKKNKTNTKYQVGDTVYVLGYGYNIYYFDGKMKNQEMGKQIKLFKMKIIKIEFDEELEPKYFTNVKTGLENSFGGYYDFDSWETIKQAIDNFVDDDYKLERNK